MVNQQRTTISSSHRASVPAWALLQRRLLADLSEAALYFADRYTHANGTLVWARDEWRGMDGSDDAYESVYNFPLLYMLGGDARLRPLAHHLWEGITWQFTEYGQIHREFDAYYDWMHHGESSLYLYYLSLAGAYGSKEQQRARRFANFYTGDDPTAPNYDPVLKLIQSPLNGSRGPRLATTPEDWAELRGIYSQYPAPFTDLPGLTGLIADWQDPVMFQTMLERFNTHIARGDVPLNLLATTLVTHAFLVTGNEAYREWVLTYLAAWEERTARNGGITPDNIGLTGRIGEYNDGKWWGGYYGWGWPHGGRTLCEALAVGGMNGLLLTGDAHHLDLFRSQWEWLWAQGKAEADGWHLPFWRDDDGWRSYRLADPRLPILVWSLTQAAADQARITRIPGQTTWDTVQAPGWGDEGNVRAWYRYITGHLPTFPEAALQSAYSHVAERLAVIRQEPTDPRQWPPGSRWENDVHHWLNRNPVTCEALVQTMLGAPMPLYHGGLLHAQVRYFDEANGRAGLPPDVAALVEQVDAQGLGLRLVNLNPLQGATLLVQAGSFGEHRLTQVTDRHTQRVTAVDSNQLRVELAPATTLQVRLDLQRFAQMPTYHRSQ